MNETVSLVELFMKLKKRWKIILLFTFIAPVIGGCITFFLLTPIYQGTTLLLVNQKTSETQIDLSQLSDNIELIKTYSVIIKSPAILGKVIDDLGLSQSIEELYQKVTISSQENSQVFSITVEDPSAVRAVEIANTISETFQIEIPKMMNVDNVSIISKAEVRENPTPVKPSLAFNITITIVVGFMIGVVLALLREVMDHSLKNENDVHSYLGLPVLGSVQEIHLGKGSKEGMHGVRGRAVDS
ncbi:YveK family protein [Bacillus sp. DJP31]|uniref:YveK family protein n=1 Tax=Bacillus sp. DJP31 TaxID=3409789 RepID=UPI003BB7730C